MKYDFLDPAQAARFPKHGWARNSDGVRLLWLPISSMVRETLVFPQTLSLELKPDQGVEAANAFISCVRRLALSLRELRRCQSLIDNHDDLLIAMRTHYDEMDLAAMHLDICYVYLRRMADRLAHALAFIFFKKSGQASSNLGSWQGANGAKWFAKSEPRCEVAALIEALHHTAWFDSLRNDGIRDMMEHHATRTQVDLEQLGNGAPQLSIVLIRDNGKRINDLISDLRQRLSEVAEFWTALCRAYPAFESDYVQSCHPLILSGNDGDVTGFWPEI